MSVPLDKQLSRRHIVGGIGAGLATLAATTGQAFAQSATPAGSTAQPVQDPTTKYPKPPFREQNHPGRVWRGRWIRALTMAKRATKVQGDC
jgi:hypothetical protein